MSREGKFGSEYIYALVTLIDLIESHLFNY